MQFSRSVECEDVSEDVWITIEEVLAGVIVVEKLLLVGAEQRFGELFQCVAPCLKSTATDIDRQLFVTYVVDGQIFGLKDIDFYLIW